MRDFIENLEAGAEARYDEMLQPDGRLKCGCGKIFDASEEGGPISDNPYAMPACGDCFEKAVRGWGTNEQPPIITRNKAEDLIPPEDCSGRAYSDWEREDIVRYMLLAAEVQRDRDVDYYHKQSENGEEG